MEKIIVLLSTYNGEKYLAQQLTSLLDQNDVDVEILVRDDGSQDGTVALLDEWKRKDLLEWYTSDNLGPGKSFMHLLETAQPGNYYAFCDQDDVWMPNKLSMTMEKMKAVEQANPGKPVIVHTDMNIVDEKLDVIHDSFWRSSGLRPDVLRTFPYLCTCNSVNGCTILMNSIARELILEKYVEHDIIIHDVICALTVSYHGGIIDYVDAPTVLYRQHSSNVVGAMAYSKGRAIIERLANIGNVVAKNIRVFKDVNKIGRISIFTYLYHKIKYLLIR
ncbi:MAG: glycosyltransferase family 2 protein [Bacteroidaceae bacterium]|nr:glycosyltransferase family 2 protein [Bacteroidaceae bacterium]